MKINNFKISNTKISMTFFMCENFGKNTEFWKCKISFVHTAETISKNVFQIFLAL